MLIEFFIRKSKNKHGQTAYFMFAKDLESLMYYYIIGQYHYQDIKNLFQHYQSTNRFSRSSYKNNLNEWQIENLVPKGRLY